MKSLFSTTGTLAGSMALAFTLLTGCVFAQTVIRPTDNRGPEVSFLSFKSDGLAAKVSPNLLQIQQDFNQGVQIQSNAAMTVRNGSVLIEAKAETPQQAQALLQQLQSLGLTQGVAHQKLVNGFLPIGRISQAGVLSTLRTINYVPAPINNVGAVTSQGRRSLLVDQLAAQYGVDGAGVKIGVLSDSYDNLLGASAGIGTGDLPGPGNPNGYNTPVEVLLDIDAPTFGQGAASDEGRAMLELVHDVAPASALAFNSAFFGRAAFAKGIRDLRAAGCDIIVDDIGYLTAPVFQDGLIAQAADAVTDDGAAYFSSAGNSSINSYQSEWREDNQFTYNFFGGLWELHEFAPGDPTQEFTLAPGGFMRISLHWDEPFASVGPKGSEVDLDILVLDEFDFPVTGSATSNIGDDAVEFFLVENTDMVPRTFKIIIGRWVDGVNTKDPGLVKYTIWRFGGVTAFEYGNQINQPTVVGHPNSSKAIAVGASAYFLTPAFGQNPPLINGFSSRGGVPILFHTDGERNAKPIVRNKPNVVGPDGTNTTFFGGDIEPDGFPNFFGTSASAPHVAAFAALLKQYFPGVTPYQIRDILQSSAIDMEDPYAGFAGNSGAGTLISRLGNVTLPGGMAQVLQPSLAPQAAPPFFDNAISGQFDFTTGYGFVDGQRAFVRAQQIKETPTVPTMSEWALFQFGFFIVLLALVSLFNLQYRLQPVGWNIDSQVRGWKLGTNFVIPFDGQQFRRIFRKVLWSVPFGFAFIYLGWGSIVAADLFFVPLTALGGAYLVYLIREF